MPMVRVQKKSTRQNHRFSQNTRPSLRGGWNGVFRALPGDRAFLPPSPARRVSAFASLAPASGRQDHTAWPSAKRSFVGMPKGQCLRPLAATAPRLHVRDDRDTPLCTRRDAKKMRLIWGKAKAEYFSYHIWTGRIDLIAQRKFDFWCKSFCGGN
jgi:hypothetical protein